MVVALSAPQSGTYIFRSCVFRRCGPVLAFYILTFSTLANSYLRLQHCIFRPQESRISYSPFPYLRFPVLALSAPPVYSHTGLEVMTRACSIVDRFHSSCDYSVGLNIFPKTLAKFVHCG